MMKLGLALATLYLLVCVRSLPPVNVFTFCNDKADGYYCANCLQPVYCNSSATPSTALLQTCDSGQACETFTTTLANCVSASSATYCYCSDPYFCDPYNEKYLVTCNDYYGHVEDVTMCDDSVGEVCRKDACVTPPSCEGVGNGTWVRFYPVCSLGYECAFNEVITERSCESNEYLTDDGSCLSAPPLPCQNNCIGNCPDETDCTRYYFCDGLGGVLSGPLDCPENSYFNPKGSPPECVANDSSVCSPMTYCDFYSLLSIENLRNDPKPSNLFS